MHRVITFHFGTVRNCFKGSQKKYLRTGGLLEILYRCKCWLNDEVAEIMSVSSVE